MGMVVDANLGLGKILEKGKIMLRPGGVIQQFIDSTVLNRIEPYLPWRKGIARDSGILHSKIGQGQLIWKTPYIRYIYYGNVMVGPKYGPKVPIEKELVYDRSRNPLAGKLWCERYKADHLNDLAELVQERVAGTWATM